MSLKHIVMPVSGMSCNGCVNAVRMGLEEIEGVISVTVSLEAGQAEITYDPTKTNMAELVAGVIDTGYSALESEIREL